MVSSWGPSAGCRSTPLMDLDLIRKGVSSLSALGSSQIFVEGPAPPTGENVRTTTVTSNDPCGPTRTGPPTTVTPSSVSTLTIKTVTPFPPDTSAHCQRCLYPRVREPGDGDRPGDIRGPSFRTQKIRDTQRVHESRPDPCGIPEFTRLPEPSLRGVSRLWYPT